MYIQLFMYIGAHSLQIHSVLYGCFSVVSDIKKDTGENIKQKIYIDKGLPPESFKLITWYVSITKIYLGHAYQGVQ